MRVLIILFFLLAFCTSASALDAQDDRIFSMDQKYSDFLEAYDKLPFWQKINFIVPRFRMKLIIKKVDDFHDQKRHARTRESAEILDQEIEKLFHEFNLTYAYATNSIQRFTKEQKPS